ncbi:MAG TPA: YtxH domain-containing protein [Sulfuricurvum sp.]|nr:YtxH domain-containing protein [Sulfuricurvum sp.]
MEQKNTIGFILGAAIGGIVAYYAFKHQDEILTKIHELEENLDLDHNTLIHQAKQQLDQLTENVKSAITRTAEAAEPSEGANEEVDALRQEISRLQAQLEALKA